MTNRSPSWNRSRDERWQDSLGGLGLSQTGNWLFRRLDLDGNGGFTGTGELDEIGTFNDVNELLARDIDADSTREERVYSCQNWRADVSAVLTDSGKMVEWVKYLAYGVPFALPAGDTDSDGDWDATDAAAILNSGSYDMRQDAELDGDVDSSDAVHAHSITGAYQTLGRGILSSAGVNNRRGYAGYEYDPTFEGAERHLYHVRHRVYDADVGRWTRRDPLGYVDGMSLYEYVASRPVTATDPDGLSWWACFKCFRELRRLGKQDHCKRKQCEDDCYEKHCGDYFAIAECLEACRQKVRKCIDDLKKTLPSCIKCAGPGKKSKIPTAPRLSTVSPTSSGGSAITASSSTPSGCPDDGESSDSDSCDDSGSNITSE